VWYVLVRLAVTTGAALSLTWMQVPVHVWTCPRSTIQPLRSPSHLPQRYVLIHCLIGYVSPVIRFPFNSTLCLFTVRFISRSFLYVVILNPTSGFVKGKQDTNFMTALTASELSAMRSTIAELLPDTCTILSPTSTPDGYGGVTTAWGTATASVACRLDMKQGREQTSGGAVTPFTSYTLSLPYDATISATWRVVVSSVTYAVTSVNSGQSWVVVTRCDLERV
jgi:head-tail adaptor